MPDCIPWNLPVACRMSAVALPEQFLTAERYLERERVAETRSEYVNGLVYAMAGGTRSHALLSANVLRLVGNQLVGRPCEAYGSDMKVRIEKANVFRYPDLSALCGPTLTYDEHDDVICNPSVIVEVLSKSTEAYDRGDKFALYRLIDSLVEYVLVSQDKIEVEVHRRLGPGKWESTLYNAKEDAFELPSIQCTVALRDLYDKVL